MERKVRSNNNNFIPARKLATNKCFTLAVNDFGDLYSWGSNADGRLGHKLESRSEKADVVENARKYDFFSNNYLKVIDASCGECHIAVVTASKSDGGEEAGAVYTWGLPLYGRLGYLDVEQDEQSVLDKELMVFKTQPKMVNVGDKVVRVACGTDFSACITVKGQLYTWGTNKSGYLGVENITYDGDQCVVTTPHPVRSLVNKVVIQVVCGSKHMMCLTSERTVFSWGSGEDGILGHGNTSGLNKPEIIKELKNDEIIFIAAGDFSSAAINNYGHLYTWGRGKYGILGHGSEENLTIPKRVMDSAVENEKIFNVALGFYHTICCTIEGKTFAWGYSEKGRLGCIDKPDCDQKKRILTPREIHTLRGYTISQVYAGLFHSFAISANTGKLWGWGENVDFILGSIDEDYEEIGVLTSRNRKKHTKTIFYKPMELKVNKNLVRISGGILDLYEAYFYYSGKLSSNINISEKGKIKKLACGGSHTLALTAQEDVYVWGYGEEGQLGLRDNIKFSQTPVKVEFGGDRKIKKIYAGYSHSMAITKTSEIYVWGDGRMGQLGRAISSSNEPLAIEDLSGRDIVKGACGYDNCAAITNDGKLYMWGGNGSFKLGLSNGNNEYENSPRLVESLNAIKKVSCGFAHTAAINNNGELYTWGHGFYGQLGHGDILTKKEPIKVDHNDLKYKKVKCGSYQTVAISKKENVYIWGRGGINLNQDPSKHKKFPEIVEDFKNVKILNCQVGNGNSLVLTADYEVFGWGDNTDGKAGGEGRTVYKVAREIRFENENKKKVAIAKIYAGYSHCFAIAENGDLYGWGSSKCFRLTSDYGDIQLVEPKMINLGANKANSGHSNEPEKTGNGVMKKNGIDERFILARLDDKSPITNFREILILIENDDIKYSDNRLIERDNELQELILEGLSKIASNTGWISTTKYMHLDKLLVLRMRKMKVPLRKEVKKNIPDEILVNMTEIEKIYTLFYLHPCFFKDYFEDEITPTNFPDFLTGIKPLFTELQTYTQKAESLDNVIYLTFFKMLIEYDLKIFRGDIDKLYTKQNSYSELLLECYFYNNYGKSILLEIFEKSLKDLYSICLNNVKSNRSRLKSKDGSAELLRTYKSLKSLFIASKSNQKDKENLKKKDIEDIINIMKSFLNDFDSNLSKLPIYVSYSLTRIKKKFYKILIDSKEKENIKEDKEKIKKGLLRLFYKNILARLLKKLIAENKGFIKQQLNMKEDDESKAAQKIFDYYVIIIAEFMEKISQNKIFSVNLEDRDESDLLYLLNNNIKEFHNRINEVFRSKLIKSKYDLKKESLSSIIYWNTVPNVKKIKVSLKDLIEFLKVLNKAKQRSRQVLGLLDFSSYKVFELFEPDTFSLKSNIHFDQTLKVSLFIDIRFLLNPKEFAHKFQTEIKFSAKPQDLVITRCSLCNLILPSCCILSQNKKDPYLIKSFSSKIKYNYLQFIEEVIRDKAFPRENNIANMKDFLNAVRDVAERKNKENSDSARIVRAAIEDMLNKTDLSDEEQFKVFLADIFNHLKTQHKHHSFINKLAKVLNDIEDATNNYISKINSINNDMDLAVESISSMENSLDFLDDNKDNVEAKRADLTHSKLRLKNYPFDDPSKFRYKMIEQQVVGLKDHNIMLEINTTQSEKDLLMQITSNTTTESFDLLVLTKKNRDVNSSRSLRYDEYVYHNINSNCFSSLSFPGFAKFNTSLLIKLLHKQINDVD